MAYGYTGCRTLQIVYKHCIKHNIKSIVIATGISIQSTFRFFLMTSLEDCAYQTHDYYTQKIQDPKPSIQSRPCVVRCGPKNCILRRKSERKIYSSLKKYSHF